MPDHIRPAKEAKAAYGEVQGAIDGYLRRQVGVSDAHPNPPPEDVAAFLATHAESLGKLVEHLRTADAPMWERDYEKSLGAPIPHLLGHLNTIKLLCAVSLAHAAADRTGEADRTLEAGWALMRSLDARVALISNLIQVASLSYLASTSSKIDGLSSDWKARLQDIAPMDNVKLAIEGDAWMYSRFAREVGNARKLWAFESSGGMTNLLVKFIENPIERPYVRMCMASYSRQLEKALATSEASDLCRTDPEAQTDSFHATIPGWNVIGRQAAGNLGGAWRRAGRAQLSLELALMVLDARAARAANGDWPQSLPLSSTACPGVGWKYDVTDGELSISLARNLPDLAPTGFSRAAPTLSFRAAPQALPAEDGAAVKEEMEAAADADEAAPDQP